MSIKLKLEGFDDLLKQIEKAGGNAQNAATKAMRESAGVVNEQLKAEMSSASVKPRLIAAMPAPKIQNDFGRITAHVGYIKGAYDPKNLSDAYKVLFLNYGTPHRSKHGKIKARGFIQKAKKKSRPKIKKIQEETLKEILKGL